MCVRQAPACRLRDPAAGEAAVETVDFVAGLRFLCSDSPGCGRVGRPGRARSRAVCVQKAKTVDTRDRTVSLVTGHHRAFRVLGECSLSRPETSVTS